MSHTSKLHKPVCVRLAALAAVSAAALALGACESHMPQTSGPAWNLDEERVEPNYANGPRVEPENAEWTAHRTYEYRGGRDPKTGRANIQM
jgi:hypothetical protein